MSSFMPARHIIGHFGDESFQASLALVLMTQKQTGQYTPKYKISKLTLSM